MLYFIEQSTSEYQKWDKAVQHWNSFKLLYHFSYEDLKEHPEHVLKYIECQYNLLPSLEKMNKCHSTTAIFHYPSTEHSWVDLKATKATLVFTPCSHGGLKI